MSGSNDGEGNGNPLQYSCLENPMDGGAWYQLVASVRATVDDIESLWGERSIAPGPEGLPAPGSPQCRAPAWSPGISALQPPPQAHTIQHDKYRVPLPSTIKEVRAQQPGYRSRSLSAGTGRVVCSRDPQSLLVPSCWRVTYG